MPDALFAIEPARTADDLAAVANLFREYEASIQIDLCFQDFEAELASLPGKYAPPHGELLLARDAQDKPIGCVALRPSDRGCEMKRLYVSPPGRGMGLGKALMNAIIDEAKRIGYQEICLDTLPTMVEAISLYQKNGFEATDPYYDTPIDGTIFMRRVLSTT
ncbi:MAG: GNAT family N-acetyltransferase [Chlorobia bacterium]|nr:GNAT family N-acetyltransferase [Fimbriimonadaceae bacterium]